MTIASVQVSAPKKNAHEESALSHGSAVPSHGSNVVESIVRLVSHPAAVDTNWSGDKPDPGSSSAPWRVYNIGNNNPVELLDVVELLEKSIGKKAIRELEPMQPGDVPATYADVDALMKEVDFKPATPIADGIARFIAWYRAYHGLK